MVATKDFENSIEEAGAIWIRENKEKRTTLSILIGDERFYGLQLKKDLNNPADEKKPDYSIVRYVGEGENSKAEIIGNARIRGTVDGRETLSIEIGTGKNKTESPLIAVMLDKSKVDDEQGPDMVIFKKN